MKYLKSRVYFIFMFKISWSSYLLIKLIPLKLKTWDIQVTVIGHKIEQFGLTLCILVESSTVIFRTSSFVILGVSGLLCRFYSIFMDNSVSKQ